MTAPPPTSPPPAAARRSRRLARTNRARRRRRRRRRTEAGRAQQLGAARRRGREDETHAAMIGSKTRATPNDERSMQPLVQRNARCARRASARLAALGRQGDVRVEGGRRAGARAGHRRSSSNDGVLLVETASAQWRSEVDALVAASSSGACRSLLGADVDRSALEIRRTSNMPTRETPHARIRHRQRRSHADRQVPRRAEGLHRAAARRARRSPKPCAAPASIPASSTNASWATSSAPASARTRRDRRRSTAACPITSPR